MKRSWMVQKGMRTDFNQEDFLVVGFAIVIAAAARSLGIGTIKEMEEDKTMLSSQERYRDRIGSISKSR